jgi:methylase of polypeptide subunit release factors
VRDFLLHADFTQEVLCRGLKLEALNQLGRVEWDKVVLEACPDLHRWCINLFLRGVPQPADEANRLVPAPVLEACFNLGLIARGTRDPQCLVCPVWVYPCAGFLLVSDRRDDPEGRPFEPAADVVFPAIYPGTLRFLDLLPAQGFSRALDHCGGSGIGALVLSRFASTAVTSDVAQRSALFAEFNARLNGCRVLSLAGDLYDPLDGQQFDFISAHPPFVPATGKTMVYRDAGETGEDITRRIIEGLPRHLSPGGVAVVLCVARDTDTQPLERRVQEWLGPAVGEFDVVYGLEKVLGVVEVVDSMRKRGANLNQEQARHLLERLQSLHTRQFVYGAICLKRLAGSAPAPKPLRIQITPEATFADFARLFDLRDRVRQPGALEALAESRPTLAPELEIRARHIVKEGELVPAEFVFALESRVCSALRLDGFLVPLVARLNGGLSLRTVFEAAARNGELPAGFSLGNFVNLVYNMLELGMLVAEVAATPGRQAQPTH